MEATKTRLIKAQLTREDFLRYLRALRTRSGPTRARLQTVILWAGGGLAALLVGGAALAASGDAALALMLAAFAGAGALAILAVRAQRAAASDMVRPDGAFLRPFQISADQDGVLVETAVSSSRIRWAGVISIETTPKLVLIYVDGASAIAAPRSAFADAAAMNGFADELRFLKRRAAGGLAPPKTQGQPA